MAKNPLVTQASAQEVNRAYGAASTFIYHLAVLAAAARQPGTTLVKFRAATEWTFPQAFIAMHDLTTLLKHEVVILCRSVYPPLSPPVRIGRSKPTTSVIEAIRDQLGRAFEQTIYPRGASPLRAAKAKPSWFEAMQLMRDEWMTTGDDRMPSICPSLRLDEIDFDELAVMLDREFHAVISEANPDGASGPLQKLQPNPIAQLTPGELSVWRHLEKAILNQSELAHADRVNSSPSAVREHVKEIRRKLGAGAIQTKRGAGYWRSDSPPDWDQVPVRKRKRRIRPR